MNNFVNRDHFNAYLKNMKMIGYGSQGACFLDAKTNTVYKVFHAFFEDEDACYSENEILRFSKIINKTFIWPSDVILVDKKIVGYTAPYIKAKKLCDTNPLNVNLNSLERAINKSYKDIKLITDHGVSMYDVMYNTLYSFNNLYVIDTIEYGTRPLNYLENRASIDVEIKLFLVDDYFNHFVCNNKLLNEMYKSIEVSSVIFISYFKQKLSEYIGSEVTTLNKAKSLIRKVDKPSYIRFI